MLLVNNPGDWGHVYAPLEHSAWHGLTPTDLIFPMFLFIVGVSATLALSPRMQRGESPRRLAGQVTVRAARIVGVGLLLHLVAWWSMDLPHFRVMGVLQRIGLCFAVAGWVVLWVRTRWQWAIWLALLAGYAALLALGGGYEPYTNLASRLDDAVLGYHVYQIDPATGRGHDPEGLLSTLGALATTLLGVRAGDWLRRGQSSRMWAFGAVALLVGQLWSLVLPLNKNLWTPSYVLWCGGVSLWLLAGCHWLIDKQGFPARGRAFGVNAIAAYAGSALLVYVLAALGWLQPICEHGFARWITPRMGPYAASLAFALAFVIVWWAIVRWLDARRIYFKI